MKPNLRRILITAILLYLVLLLVSGMVVPLTKLPGVIRAAAKALP